MAEILKDRMTATRDDGIVVFLIGMRINSWWKIHRWLPVARAMPPMLKELFNNPESGLLSATFALTTQGPLIVQYWSSIDKLMSYASDRTAQHYPAWVAFNRAIGKGGDVGIWHETYSVPRGNFESIYVNMPAFGLGKVGKLEPARGHRSRARGRLAPGGAAPALPSPKPISAPAA